MRERGGEGEGKRRKKGIEKERDVPKIMYLSHLLFHFHRARGFNTNISII